MPEQREYGSVVSPANSWCGTWNNGPAPNSAACIAAGDARRDDQRDERAARELEEQQLDREHDRRERCAERRRHPRGRAARQQDLALDGRHRDHLPDERPERAARDDDRAFGAERSAGADRDRGRQRLGHRGREARSGSAW